MAVRDARATCLQLEKLFDYMVEHSEFARGRLVGKHGKNKSMEMWESLSASLNALGTGPPKPVFKWRKCWTDWKNNIKKKAQKLRVHARVTGGGPPKSPLSGLEERLLEWMTPESVEGDMNVPEGGGFSDPLLETFFDEEVNRVGDLGDLVKVEEKRARIEERKQAIKEKQLQQEDRRIALQQKREAREERRDARQEKMEERREAREERRDAWLMALAERWFRLQEGKNARES